MGRAIEVDNAIDDLKRRMDNLEQILNDLNKPKPKAKKKKAKLEFDDNDLPDNVKPSK